MLIATGDRRPLELLRCVEDHFKDPEQCRPTVRHWRGDVPIRSIEKGASICFEDTRPFTLHWGFGGWQGIQDRDSIAGLWGLWSVELSSTDLRGHEELNFTRRYAGVWEGVDHTVSVT